MRMLDQHLANLTLPVSHLKPFVRLGRVSLLIVEEVAHALELFGERKLERRLEAEGFLEADQARIRHALIGGTAHIQQTKSFGPREPIDAVRDENDRTEVLETRSITPIKHVENLAANL